MLERVRIHNVGPFDSLDVRLGPIQLLMGQNGSGKSCLVDVLTRVRKLVSAGESIENVFSRSTRTRWLPDELNQVIELSVSSSEHGEITYALGVRHAEHGGGVAINSETLTVGSTRVIFGSGGQTKLTDRSGVERDFGYSMNTSVLRVTPVNYALPAAAKWFIEWLSSLLVVRIVPSSIVGLASSPARFLSGDASNFAAWYQYLAMHQPESVLTLRDELRESLDGFRALRFDEVGNNTRELNVEFTSGFYKFGELSDGQRALIVLYAILYFAPSHAHTLVLDEPDNYLALREIQPWLLRLQQDVGRGRTQALIISHHPEILDQVAAPNGLLFRRKQEAPGIEVVPFAAGPTELRPSEVVARGWEQEP